MKFERCLSEAGIPVRDQVDWVTRDVLVPGAYEQKGVEVPAGWSDTAVGILASKYFRKAGVPRVVYPNTDPSAGVPLWLIPSRAVNGTSTGSETSGHQVFHRLAGCWAYWGWREGVFDDEEAARVFYDECYLGLARQFFAPNSPQWFNTGLHWAYGIEGAANGQWAVDDEGEPYLTPNAYERPQVHACFIQPMEDDLVNEGGIMDLVLREARVFKHGSGSGTNASKIRSKYEYLSGGGRASGVMSFLRVSDRAAGAIKSGGTTRRAAKIWVLDANHPEIEDFIWWKANEEAKAAAMAVGNAVLREHSANIAAAHHASAGDEDYATGAARAAGVPEAMIDRARFGIATKPLDLGWESEALDTVSGQNANNSVRVTDEFMRLSETYTGPDWHLTARTSGATLATVSAKALLGEAAKAAWASGDPGIQFHNTINAWHTCPMDGPIVSTNPCGEYNFLDDTACNLASLRLWRFLNDDDTWNLDLYEHVARLGTVVLEISVFMAAFPSREIARRSYLYRTLGLGYADLGGVLMRLGLPYASGAARGLAAGLTALMTGVAYRTSAELAAALGPFERFEANAPHMRRVIYNHVAAAWRIAGRAIDDLPAYIGLNVEPYTGDRIPNAYGELADRVVGVWAKVNRATAFRNAQATLTAPTGTISFVMDCVTTGCEPEFSLVRDKLLAGGGTLRLVNAAVPYALRKLGYDEAEVKTIVKELETGDLSEAVKPEHRAVFQCSNGAGALAALDHVLMVAATQPFLSGAVSKTVNLPNGATVEDFENVFREAHRLGVKAVAPYRDGSKLNQPLAVVGGTNETKRSVGSLVGATGTVALARGKREYLPWRREKGFTQKIKIGDLSVYLHAREYPDGRLGEIYVELSHEGSTLRGLAGLLGMAVSIGLQYGVPPEEFVDQFTHTKFEPAGMVEGHDRLRFVSSIGDYIGRELALSYCGRDDLAPPSLAVITETLASGAAAKVAEVSVAINTPPYTTKLLGYTGELCPNCHNATLRPSGPCLKCDTCGETTGCS